MTVTRQKWLEKQGFRHSISTNQLAKLPYHRLSKDLALPTREQKGDFRGRKYVMHRNSRFLGVKLVRRHVYYTVCVM